MRSIVRAMIVGVAGCAGLRGATAGPVRTVYVPSDYPTIQQAIDAVGQSGNIIVAAGEFEPFVVRTSDLTIRGGRDSVIDGGSRPAIVVNGERVVVEGFTVVSRDVGVSIQHGADITVRDITVRSAGLDGIRADTVTDITVTGNRIESAGGTGIDVVATASELFGPLTVTSNTVLSAGGDGILVHNIGDGSDMVVTDNVVTNVDGRGIRTECGMTLDVSRNDVSSTGGTAVSIYQVNDHVTVSQNTVADSGGAGIDVLSAPRVDVTDNRIDRSAGDGVTIEAPNVLVGGNSVTDAGNAGIRVDNAGAYRIWTGIVPGADAAVSDNVVTRPAGTGIVVGGSLPIGVSENTITDPGVHGVELDGARGVHVSGNEVTGAGSCGFRLENGARGNVLTGNTATDCTQGLFAPGAARKRNRIAKSNRFGRRHARR